MKRTISVSIDGGFSYIEVEPDMLQVRVTLKDGSELVHGFAADGLVTDVVRDDDIVGTDVRHTYEGRAKIVEAMGA